MVRRVGRGRCTEEKVMERRDLVKRVQLVAPSGKVLHTLSVPEVPAACALGGDGRLYVAAKTSLYGLKVPASEGVDR
jgi:sugar lactone lactonase YvrE